MTRLVKHTVAAGLFAISVVALSAPHGPVEVSNCLIRALPGNLPPGGYFKVTNSSEKPVDLIAVKWDAREPVLDAVLRGDAVSLMRSNVIASSYKRLPRSRASMYLTCARSSSDCNGVTRKYGHGTHSNRRGLAADNALASRHVSKVALSWFDASNGGLVLFVMQPPYKANTYLRGFRTSIGRERNDDHGIASIFTDLPRTIAWR